MAPFSIEFKDIATIGLLIFLEGILSIDNAVVLALLAGKLPPRLQKKALTYGLAGAFIFRFIALFFVSHLMRWVWVKFVGGAYLIYIALVHFWPNKKQTEEMHRSAFKSFWKAVVVIELTDLAFAVDSILAAVAVSPKFWVVFIGGCLGVVLMRFAASIFISLLKRFPGFETSAYILVLIIGMKLFVMGFQLPNVDFHTSSSPAFWIFWASMLLALGYGFLPKAKTKS